MKISRIQTYLFYPGAAKNLLFCRIETTDGVYGWGEAYVGKSKEKVVDAFINAIAPSLIGREVFNIRHMKTVLFDDWVQRRGSVDFYSAMSAIEIALWDIVGKYTNQPVYNLLGGRHRQRIRLYANGWWKGANTIEETVKRAAYLKELGYNAIKWDPFTGPWRYYITQETEDAAVENVRAVREALGPDIDLMVEMHRRLSPYQAIHFAKRIEEFDPFVIEEPCLSDNIDLVVQAKKSIKSRLVTGETCYTKSEFKNIFEKGAADIINPEICICGGITGLLDLAVMAEPYNITLSPHNYNSTIIGLSATLHVSAVIPNFNIAEIFVNLKPGCDAIDIKPIKIDQGFAELPTEPGLGIDIDIEALKKRPYHEFEPIELLQYYMEYPCKSDFVKQNNIL